MEQDNRTTRDIVIAMEGMLANLCQKVAAHDTDLNGNGKPGLKSDMRQVQGDIADIKKLHDEEKSYRAQVKILAIGEVLTLVGLAVALIFGLK